MNDLTPSKCMDADSGEKIKCFPFIVSLVWYLFVACSALWVLFNIVMLSKDSLWP